MTDRKISIAELEARLNEGERLDILPDGTIVEASPPVPEKRPTIRELDSRLAIERDEQAAREWLSSLGIPKRRHVEFPMTIRGFVAGLAQGRADKLKGLAK